MVLELTWARLANGTPAISSKSKSQAGSRLGNRTLWSVVFILKLNVMKLKFNFN